MKSMLTSSALARVAGAFVLVALLWLGVLWAIGGTAL